MKQVHQEEWVILEKLAHKDLLAMLVLLGKMEMMVSKENQENQVQLEIEELGEELACLVLMEDLVSKD